MASLSPPPPDLLEGAALFLDFDGTLVELADTPDAIRVPPRLRSLLQRLRERLGGRLAIVSGRSLASLERHVPFSDIALSGSHGLELRLADGTDVPLFAHASLEEVRCEVNAFAEPEQGLLVENKPASVALHYRQAPQEEERVVAFVEKLARAQGLMVQRGKMVVELRPNGADKGDALRAFMKEPEFAGARPLFVGDDLTDEDAFAAAAGMGGGGVLVGPPRPTRAEWRLDDVSAVADWLSQATGLSQ